MKNATGEIVVAGIVCRIGKAVLAEKWYIEDASKWQRYLSHDGEWIQFEPFKHRCEDFWWDDLVSAENFACSLAEYRCPDCGGKRFHQHDCPTHPGAEVSQPIAGHDPLVPRSEEPKIIGWGLTSRHVTVKWHDNGELVTMQKRGAEWVAYREPRSIDEIAAEQKGQDANGWSNIDSAPKDGTRVLLCHRGLNDIGIVLEGYYCEDEGWYESNTHPTDATDGRCDPAHWMRLPEPPSIDQPAGGPS